MITLTLVQWTAFGMGFFGCGLVSGMAVMGFRFSRPKQALNVRQEADTLDGIDVRELIADCKNPRMH